MSVNFVNSDLRQKVDQLMDELWAGGVNNPMTSVEQISYLMFLKSLTEKDEEQEKLQKIMGNAYVPIFTDSWSKYSWRTVSRLAGDALYNTVSEVFEKFHELPNLSSMGKLLFRQAHLKIYNRPTLRSVVALVDDMDFNDSQKYDTDVKGDLYEYLLSRIAVSGTNGQFRTPRHIIKMMVEILDPQPGQYILDPACGTAGFLIQAYLHIMEKNTSDDMRKDNHIAGDLLRPDQHEFMKTHALTGYDNDTDMIKVAIMNLYLHGLENANVRHHDPITLPNPQERKYDLILANPPFAGTVNREAILEDFDLRTTKTELLFGEYFYKHLAPGGRAAVIVPEGVVMGTDNASRKLRQILLEDNNIEAVISLPHFSFKPYASVATFILVFQRGGKTQKCWMYKVDADGFSKDGVRNPVKDNDIPDLLKQWNKRNKASYKSAQGKHDWVSAERIASNNFELAPRAYLQDVKINHDYNIKTIKELCTLTKGTISAAKAEAGLYPLVTTSEELKTCKEYNFEGEAVCVPLVSSTGHGHASIKRLTYMNGKFSAATIVAVLRVKNNNEVITRFLYYFLETHKDEILVPLMKGAANVSLSLEKIGPVKIPVPSITEQKKFIKNLENIYKETENFETKLAATKLLYGKALVEFKSIFSE